MLMRNIPEPLNTMVARVVTTLGYQLWGIQLLPKVKSGQLLRVYIDTPAGEPSDTAKPNGVNLADCTLVSRQLSAMLDVEEPIAGEYVLEVSSPGIDRPVFTLEQFVGLSGSQVRIKLNSTLAGRKNYRGKLLAVENQVLKLQVDDELIELPFADVDSAHVVPEF